jgi:hypothetical protein
LHHDHASAHNSRLFSEKIESAKAERVSHPPYSQDPARSDFFLFGHLKEKLRGTSFTTSDDFSFAIRQIFSQILEMGVKNGFTNCGPGKNTATRQSGFDLSKGLGLLSGYSEESITAAMGCS